jgi:hypothetical protein
MLIGDFVRRLFEKTHCLYILDPLPSRVNSFADWDNSTQIYSEIEAIYRFFEETDASGLRLPEDSQEFRSALRSLREAHMMQPGRGVPWPQPKFWSLLPHYFQVMAVL